MIKRGLLFIFILALGALALLLTTEMGLQWSFDMTSRVLPGELKVEKLNGYLLGRIDLRNLTYTDEGTNLELKKLQLRWQSWALLTGRLKITKLHAHNLSIKTLTSDKKNDTNVAFHFPFKLRLQDFRLRGLHIQEGKNKPITVGEIVLKSRLDADQVKIKGHWRDIVVPIDYRHTLLSPKANIHIHGPISDYRINLTAELKGLNLPGGTWRLQGRGDQTSLHLTQITSDTLSGDIKGDYQLRWIPSIQWKGELHARHMQPKSVWPLWSGNINFDLYGTGKLEKDKLFSEFKLLNLSGNLREYPVKGHATIALEDNHLTLIDTKLISAQSQVSVEGSMTDRWDLDWDLQVPNLNQLLPNSSGRLTSTGHIHGPRETPRINIQADGVNLTYIDKYLESLNATVDFDFKSPQHMQANINAIQYHDSLHAIDSATLTVTGKPENHSVQLNLLRSAQQFNVNLQGGLAQQQWTGAIQQLSLQSRKYGNWGIKKPAPLFLSQDKMKLEHFCWQADNEKLCLNANWQTGTETDINITSNTIDLKHLSPLLPANVKLTGTGQVNAKLQRSEDGKLSGTGTVKLGPGELRYPFQGHTETFDYRSGELIANLNDAGLQSTLDLDLPNSQTFKGELGLQDYQGKGLPKPKQALKGQAEINLTNLSLISSLYPQLKGAQGELNVNLSVDGTLEKPMLNGVVILKNGKAKLPNLGITLSKVGIHIQGDGSGKITYTGNAHSGRGDIQFTGDSDLADKDKPTNIQILGIDFLFIDTQEYRVYASPDLSVIYKGNRLDLNGKLHIPRGTIRPEDFSSDSIVLPDDIVYVHTAELAKKTKLNVYSHIDLSLGKKVTLKIMGISGKLGGHLVISDEPKRVATATGQLRVRDGHYRAYGQNLDIRTGQLIFTGGPVTNPGLDVQAVRRIRVIGSQADIATETTEAKTQLLQQTEELVVGINVKGTLNNPQLSLFAEPAAYSQSDILSYLVLGKSTTDASATDGSLLIQAASALNFAGGETSHLVEQISHTFGIDTVTIETQHLVSPDTNEIIDNTALVLGTALSSRLYVDYSIGLIEPINTLSVRYLLSKGWTVRSQTNSITSALDFLYTIERD